MWQCAVLLVSCLAAEAAALSGNTSVSAKPVSRQFSVDVGEDAPYLVKYSIVNGEVSGRTRGTREVLYPSGVFKLQGSTGGKGLADVAVKSSRLKVEVPGYGERTVKKVPPASRRYLGPDPKKGPAPRRYFNPDMDKVPASRRFYNPDLKKVAVTRRYYGPELKKAPVVTKPPLRLLPAFESDFLLEDLPFRNLPKVRDENFLGFGPSGLPARRDLLLLPAVSNSAPSRLPAVNTGRLQMSPVITGSNPNMLSAANTARSPLSPVITGSNSSAFSTRPPWTSFPRGPGPTEVKPQRAKTIPPGSIPANLLTSLSKNRKTTSTVNVADLIKQVEQLIITSQNSNATSTGRSDRRWKHPSL